MTEYDIFISHATPDDAAADKVYDALTANGYKVFLDHKSINPGDQWEKAVQEAMIHAKAGVILLSHESLNRDTCNGERQYFFSKYQRKEVRVFTALLENLTPDEIPFSVNAIQYVNLSSDFDGQLARLVSAIQDKITLTALESKELPPEAPKSTLADARLLKDPNDLGENESPTTLIGREDDLAKILALLDAGQRTVIQAHGGAGKTALAGKLTEGWLKTIKTKSPVLWMRAGSAGADGMFEAVGHAFGQDQAMAAAQGEDKVHLTRQLLQAVSLVVVDDVWNAPGIARFANAVPRNCPLLVTSRLRLDALDELYVLDDLSDAAALDLLVHHGGKRNDPDAPRLIDTLGNLAFALEIAGKTLKRTGDTAGQLLQKMKDSPHELRLNSAEAGRENVAALIDASLKTLDDFTRKVFLAFGAFFDPQVTVELMAMLFVGELDISDELVAQVRADNPQVADLADEQLRDLIRFNLLQQADITPIEKAFSELHDSGLAQRMTEFDRLPPEHPPASTYRIHDLSYAYAALQMSDRVLEHTMQACISYTKLYSEPGWNSFPALLPVLDGLLKAAAWGFAHGYWQTVEDFANNLIGGSEILDYLGYAGPAIALLENATVAAKTRGDTQTQGRFMGELGIMYAKLGCVDIST